VIAWVNSYMTRCDDRMNPIVVKEVRQAVRGRNLTATLNVFLAVQLLIMASFLFGSDVDDLDTGRMAFGTLSFVLTITCTVVMPTQAAGRFSAERRTPEMDMILTTSLTARRVLWGKINAVLLTVTMIFAAFLPFLALTYLLRGIDLPTIFFALFGDLVMAYVCTVFAMSVACCGRNLVTRFFAGAIGLAGLLIGMMMTSAYNWALASEGVELLLEPGFWAAVFMMGMFTFMVVVAAYAIGLDNLRPTGVRRTASERAAYRTRQNMRRRRHEQAAAARAAMAERELMDRGTLPPVDLGADTASTAPPAAPPPLPLNDESSPRLPDTPRTETA